MSPGGKIIRPVLLRTALSLSLVTFVGLAVASLFVVSLSNIRLAYVTESGWLIVVVAVVLIVIHSLISLSVVRDVMEIDEEVGLDNASPAEARQALEALLRFIPVTSVLAAVNWGLGGVVVAVAIYWMYPVTILDAITVWLGAVSAGLVISVIFYQALKLRFQDIFSLLLERARVRSGDDPLFEHHRVSLRSELQLSFVGLILVAVLFGAMFGYTQTQRTVVSTLVTQVGFGLNSIGSVVSLEPWESTRTPRFREALTRALVGARPSPGGRYFWLGPSEDAVELSEEASAYLIDYRAQIEQSEKSDWQLTRTGDLVVWEPAYGGKLVALLPAEDMRHNVGGSLLNLLMLTTLLLVTILGSSYFLAQSITRPLAELQRSFSAIAHGNLSEQHPVGGLSEVGALALSAGGTLEALRETVSQIRTAHGRLSDAAGRVGFSSEEVAGASNEQEIHLRQTLASLTEVYHAVEEVTSRVEDLDRASRQALRNVSELGQGTAEVRDSASAVAASVGQTNSSIFEMATSISNVSEHMDSLRESAQDTAASVAQLEASIGHVEHDALETNELSQKVLADAEAGAEAVSSTIAGVNEIRATSQEAVRTIQTLGTQMKEIGKVVTVIDEVAAQTHLLSLNAAIIAAQAGEHGQGFAVVADEIKKLATQTAKSTGEIAELLRAIQHQAAKGVEKVLEGEKAVERGQTLSLQAREVLAQIEASARQSTERMGRIARATTEQVAGVRQITHAVENMVAMIENVSQATSEQRRGADQIAQASESMRGVAERVDVAARRQEEAAQAIREQMARIAEMVEHVLASTQQQLHGIDLANQYAEHTGKLAGKNLKLTEQLRQVVVDLSQESAALTEALARFREN